MTTTDLFNVQTTSDLLLDFLDRQHEPNSSDRLGDFLEAVRPLAMVIARQLGANDPEDATQEVLMHLTVILNKYDRNPSNLRAWLSAVIRNKMISIWRAENSRNPESVSPELLEDITEDDPPPMAEVGVDSQRQALELWLRARFPTVQNSDAIAEAIMDGLLNGTPARNVTKTLLSQAVPAMHPGDAQVVWQSSVFFLRMLSLPDGRLNIPAVEFNEFSILPELALMVGVAPTQAVAVLLGGQTIKFN